MIDRIRLMNCATLFLAAALSVVPLGPARDGDRSLVRGVAAFAQGEDAGGITEKEAFEGAKELGTIEAWEAFLNRFPDGFRADLARAYVKKLAGDGGLATRQPAAQDDGSATGQQLQALDLGPGEQPWETGSRILASAGNQQTYTASVQGNGLELVAYCDDLSRTGGSGYGLLAVLRENPRGAYPDFQARLSQALSSAPEHQGRKSMRVSFSGGKSFSHYTFGPPNSAGEVAISDAGKAMSDGLAFQEVLAAQSMTFSAPPFSATFQLEGSRAAVCDVLERCGVRQPECAGGDDDKKTVTTSKPRKPEPKLSREAQCRSQGLDYSNGKCVAYKKSTAKPKEKKPSASAKAKSKAKAKAKAESNAAANCKELGLAYRNGQCVAKLKADIKRLKKQKKIGCPEGTYLNPLGVCQPNETGG